jgi:hypothetical protein
MSCGYAHVISHTDARMKYKNRGPKAIVCELIMLISINYIYYHFPGLEDHPIHFQRRTVRVSKFCWGTIGFFCGARKKIRSSPLRQASVWRCWGVPPRGGPPEGGNPPRGVAPHI